MGAESVEVGGYLVAHQVSRLEREISLVSRDWPFELLALVPRGVGYWLQGREFCWR